MDRLDIAKSNIECIKEHLVDMDAVLLDDDISALQEAEEDLKAGRTKSF